MPAISGSIGDFPLTEEYPGVPPAQRSPDAVAPAPQVTTLANGVRVATYDSNDLATTVGVVVGMGTRNETSANAGACHLMKAAAYGGTENRTSLRLVRDMEELGAHFSAGHGREVFSLTASCMRNKLGGVVDAMAESLRQPTMKIWELRENANTMIDDSAANADGISDALHAAAFYDSETLGQPLYDTTARLYDSDELSAFRAPFLVGSNIVVAGASATHTDLVKVATEQFGDVPAGSAPAAPSAEYVGGEARITGSGATEVGVVFPIGAADAATGSVLAEVLGCGQAVQTTRSIGGGNTSRLAAIVGGGVLDSAQGVSFAYSDVGLVGVTATAAAGVSGLAAFESLAGALKAVAAGVEAAECDRAKSRLKGKLLAQMESGETLVGQMAADVLATGNYQTVSQQLAAIDAVGAAQVTSVAAAALKAAPACATVGNTGSVPRYNKLAALFK